MKYINRLQEILETVPDITHLAIDFFTCAYYDKSDFFQDISTVMQEKYKNKVDESRRLFAMGGRLSINDFQYYVQTKRIIDGFPMGISDTVVKALEEKNVILEMNRSFTETEETLYVPNIPYAKFLRDNKLLENLIFGNNFIIEKYKSSIALIEIVDQKNDISVGSGFLISHKIASFVVTNKHVVENSKQIKVYLNGQIKKHVAVIESKNSDIAFIQLIDNTSTNCFFLNPNITVLADIITMGYPSIPMTKDAYQVYHKGEINSFVQDYGGNDLFLISAKTSSGNSGSPVIDNHGSVLGMITMELFEEKALLEKGKLPYYAAIPSSLIISELELVI